MQRPDRTMSSGQLQRTYPINAGAAQLPHGPSLPPVLVPATPGTTLFGPTRSANISLPSNPIYGPSHSHDPSPIPSGRHSVPSGRARNFENALNASQSRNDVASPQRVKRAREPDHPLGADPQRSTQHRVHNPDGLKGTSKCHRCREQHHKVW